METAAPTATSPTMELVSIARLKEAWQRADPIEFADPIFAHTALPHRKTYYPLGFPLELETNSKLVLTAADQSWEHFTPLFDRKPIRLSVAVNPGESRICPAEPICRTRNHLVTSIADGENFAIADRDKGMSFVWVTDAALQAADYFRYYFLESSAMAQIAARYATGVHAACVVLDGSGVLLCGDSGAGKSTLSYACARAGWTYVTDDGSYLINGRTDRLVVGNCTQVRLRPHAESFFPELQGMPILQRAGAGKPSIELFTKVRPKIATVPTANVRHIVFLNRETSDQRLAAFPRAVARMYMLQRVHCLPYRMSEQIEAVERLLEVETHELRYNDLHWAVKELSRLVRKGS